LKILIKKMPYNNRIIQRNKTKGKHMRKLASIRKIKDIKPIKNADRIVLVQVDGWWCITKKDEFQKGELGVYFEIDSLLPHEDIYSFLGKASLRDGEYRYRIKTMKMRGVISQGLLLPLGLFEDRLKGYKEGDDVTEVLNVKKYDDTQKFKSKSNSPQTKSRFPSFLIKTDQERIQNLVHYFEDKSMKELEFEETLKLDGSSHSSFKIKESLPLWKGFVNKLSLTVFNKEVFNTYRFGFCSRNLELKEAPKGNKQSNFEKVVHKYNIKEELPIGYAIQGELIAPDIQSNHEKIKEPELYIFNVFDVEKQEYLKPQDARKFVNKHFTKLKYIPVVNEKVKIFKECKTLEDMLERVEGQSMNKDTVSEGRVYKCTSDSNIHFKCISNTYLLQKK